MGERAQEEKANRQMHGLDVGSLAGPLPQLAGRGRLPMQPARTATQGSRMLHMSHQFLICNDRQDPFRVKP